MTAINKYNAPLICFAHWDKAFSSEEVDRIKQIEDLQVFQKGVIGQYQSEEELKAARDSSVFFMTHDDNTNWLYQKVSTIISTANTDHFLFNVDDFGPMQYTKYGVDGHYTWHWDVHFGWQQKQRKISVIIMLK